MIVTRHGRRPFILRAPLVIALSVTGLAACTSGGSGSSSVGTPTSAAPTTVSMSVEATPTPSPTPSLAPPLLPAAAKQPTQAGAEAFYRYFWDVYSYTFLSLDAEPLKRASVLPECTYCAAVTKNIEVAQGMSLHYSGGAVSVLVAVAAPGKPADGLLVNGIINQEGSQAMGPSRTSSQSFPPKTKVAADSVVRWVGGRWLMAETKVANPS